MTRRSSIILLTVLLVCTAAGRVCVAGLSLEQAITACGDSLVAQQIKSGTAAGTWLYESGYTGSIVAGLVHAYQAVGDTPYRTAAELGGASITNCTWCNYYGDEAYALFLLSEISDDPASNLWRTALAAFYNQVKTATGGTQGYIAGYVNYDPASATFYIAHHVVAADYVNAADRLIWRQALIDYLACIDDSSSYFSVLGLGVATWALALTGPLDDTVVDPSGTGSTYWSGKRLCDLPALLVSHQVPPGQPWAGSFYWRFDHGNDGSDDPVAGYSEDAVFAAFGLLAASAADPGLDLAGPIIAAREALLAGVMTDGTVAELLSGAGEVYCAYAGEMLNVLSEMFMSGWVPGSGIYDLDGDNFIGPGDFSLFACCWLHPATDDGCFGQMPCIDCDFDCDGQVGPGDFSWFATGWLKYSDDPSVVVPDCQNTAPMAEMSTARMLPASIAPQVRVRLVTLSSPSASDTTRTLPSAVSSLSQGRNYYVELWAADVRRVRTGLTSVYVDLLYDASEISVRSVDHGKVFTLFPSGTIQRGVIDELGGSALITDGRELPWVRVATITMHANISGTPTLSLTRSDSGIAASGSGLIRWLDVGLDGGPSPSCGDPDRRYPPGDLNLDCHVTFEDMNELASRWLQSDCGPSQQCDGADLDGSGQVDLRDFCILADKLGGQGL